MSDEIDEVASFYDEHGEQLGLTENYRHLEPVLPTVSEKRVLDAGCGLGNGSAYLAANGASVTGIDISEEEIAIARERHGDGIDFFQVDLQDRLSMFDNGEFDIVVCALTLAHLQDWNQPFMDYLELAVGEPQQARGEGEVYGNVEQFSRPWGPDGETMPFYRRPLGELLRPALEAGFVLEEFIEPGSGPHESEKYDPSYPPRHLLLRFRR